MVVYLNSCGFVDCRSYHAGLSENDRRSNQQDWLNNKYKIVIATSAFGMGIDKQDVRFVIHYSMPASLEQFYQESGRAGQDGKIATSILIYDYCDFVNLRKLIEGPMFLKNIKEKKLKEMLNFAESLIDCRRKIILNYFGELYESCGIDVKSCDNCLTRLKYIQVDVKEIVEIIIKCVKYFCGISKFNFTLLQLTDLLKGNVNKKFNEKVYSCKLFFGRLRSWLKSDLYRLLRKLLFEDYLAEYLIEIFQDVSQMYVKAGPKLLNEVEKVYFTVNKPTDSLTPNFNSKLIQLNEQCLNELLKMCSSVAAGLHVTLDSLIDIEVLRTLSIKLPANKKQMAKILQLKNYSFEEKLLQITLQFAAAKILMFFD